MKKEEAARRLLEAMTEIDDRYIAEAMPKEIVEASRAEDNAAPIRHVKRSSKETESQTASQGAEEGSPKVLYMKPKHRWQPVGIVAAAAVLMLGLGVYHLIGNQTAAQAPAKLSETGAPAMAKAFSADSGVTAETVPDANAAAGSMAESTASEDILARAGTDTYSISAAESRSEENGTEDTGAVSGMQIANPWSDFDQLADAEADAGFQIVLPESYAGFDHRLYRSMHKDMLEVIYQNTEEQEGFRIRKAQESGDISGDYTNYTTEVTQDIAGHTVQLRGNGEDIFVATWSAGEYSYAICVASDQHFSEEDLQALIEAIDPA